MVLRVAPNNATGNVVEPASLSRVEITALSKHKANDSNPPATIAEVADYLVKNPTTTLLAGSTEIGLQVNKQFSRPDHIMYLGNVKELRQVTETASAWRIGAAVSLTQVEALVAQAYPDFTEVLRRFGSPPIRSTATLAGNIANGSPIGDTMPCLMALGASLVLRRGDQLTPRTWADMGVRLRPEFVGGVGAWMAPLGGQAAASAGGAAGGAASEVQTVFQMLPQAVPGLTEYTIEVDGQVLRYRNGKASWAHFVWPGPGTPGVKIAGVSYDGTPINFFQEPGRFGLERMINSAQRRRARSPARCRTPNRCRSKSIPTIMLSSSSAA